MPENMTVFVENYIPIFCAENVFLCTFWLFFVCKQNANKSNENCKGMLYFSTKVETFDDNLKYENADK